MLHHISLDVASYESFDFLNPERVNGCIPFLLILDTFVLVFSRFTSIKNISFIKDAENLVWPLFDVFVSVISKNFDHIST